MLAMKCSYFSITAEASGVLGVHGADDGPMDVPAIRSMGILSSSKTLMDPEVSGPPWRRPRLGQPDPGQNGHPPLPLYPLRREGRPYDGSHVNAANGGDGVAWRRAPRHALIDNGKVSSPEAQGTTFSGTDRGRRGPSTGTFLRAPPPPSRKGTSGPARPGGIPLLSVPPLSLAAPPWSTPSPRGEG